MRKDLHPKKQIETTEMECYIMAKIFYMLFFSEKKKEKRNQN